MVLFNIMRTPKIHRLLKKSIGFKCNFSNTVHHGRALSTYATPDNTISSTYEDVFIPDTNLAHLLISQCSKFKHKVAYINSATQQKLSYSQLQDDIIKTASSLVKLGIGQGDVVTIFTSNCPEFAVMFLAAAAIGAISSTVNPVYTVGELEHTLLHSESKLLVTLPSLVNVAKTAAKKSPHLKNIVTVGQAEGCIPFSALTQDDGSKFPENLDIKPSEDLLTLPYSSGTTGFPKGVMLTHTNLTANVLQISTEKTLSYTSDDVLLAVLPFYHIYGQTVTVLAGLYNGTTSVILPKFEPQSFLKTIQDYKVTYATLVPPITLFLAKHPLVQNYDMTSVRRVINGAAPIGRDVIEEAKMKLRNASFTQAYGLTETSPIITMSPPDTANITSIGRLVSNTKAKIIDAETGQPLQAGQEGELVVQGPQVMKGYFKNPEATDKTMSSDQWFHTGDIAYYDEDGWLFITERLKELIKYKGLQVAPAELEALLVSHPGIQDAAVVGVPDERAGELPRAHVVPKPDVKLSADDIHAFVKGKVAPYKELTGGIIFETEIPKTASGKILRRQLRAK